VANASLSSVDFADIQGIVRFGYKYMTEACYLLLEIKDAGAARVWLAGAPVSSAREQKPPPATALQVAFTAPGLQALGVPPAVMAGFSSEFLSGMTGEESRSRRLGDFGANAPGNWRWGGNPRATPHLVVMFFAQPGKLGAWMGALRDRIWESAFHVIHTLETTDLHGKEPFGFTDGISEPELDWELRRPFIADQLSYGNLIALGECLLGFKNEYGKYTDRPVTDSGDLPAAEDNAGKRDVGRNGTYLVMRHLEQDVRKFWQFADRAAGQVASARDKLAETMVGRTLEGDPLVAASGKSEFTYDGDANGMRCPLGAHVRRANPRTADYPAGVHAGLDKLVHQLALEPRKFRDDLMASTRFHRILRRGREYGPGLAREEALQPAPPGDPERGLHFICLNANISRQFEFVQNAWLMNSKFNGMNGETDPLLGNREPIAGGAATDRFRIPREAGLCSKISGMPQFVKVRGGAYFFLPGLRALRYFVKAEA
jgi:Dyp-type peroxidase family